MSFREGMNPIVAAAEWEIRKRLDLEGIHMEYQKQIVLDAHNVDIYGELPQAIHCFEVDGPIHFKSDKVKRRDEYVTARLEKRHFKVWHLPYTPPISKERLTEIVEFIKSKGFIGKLRLTQAEILQEQNEMTKRAQFIAEADAEIVRRARAL